MHAVLNAALPIFALILTGFACGRSGVPSPAATDSPNRFAIYLALPALMFLAMTVLARNPLRLRPFAGFAVGMSRLGLPDPIERSASLLGGAASPCALVCIGLFLAQERLVSSYALAIGVLVGLKLLFQPAVTAVVAFYIFDVPPVWSRPAVLLSALPIGSGPFTVAKLYGLQPGVTSGAILASQMWLRWPRYQPSSPISDDKRGNAAHESIP
jgi:predicted permease